VKKFIAKSERMAVNSLDKTVILFSPAELLPGPDYRAAFRT
jgi:hypothetical protein